MNVKTVKLKHFVLGIVSYAVRNSLALLYVHFIFFRIIITLSGLVFGFKITKLERAAIFD